MSRTKNHSRCNRRFKARSKATPRKEWCESKIFNKKLRKANMLDILVEAL